MMSLFLISCWEKEELWVVEESLEIVETYIDTLETSVIDAREATEAMNTRQAALQESLDTQ